MINTTGGIVKSLLAIVVRLRNGAFKHGTTTMQLLSIWFASSFFLAFIFNGNTLVETPAYVNFNGTNWWLYMGLLAFFQFVFLVVPSLRCNILAGFMLLVSAPMWGVVSINFADTEHFNTGVLAYGGFAIACGMAGWRLIDLYDFKLSVKRGVECAQDSGMVMGSKDVGKSDNRAERTNNTTSNFCNDRRVDGGLCVGDTKGEA